MKDIITSGRTVEGTLALLGQTPGELGSCMRVTQTQGFPMQVQTEDEREVIGYCWNHSEKADS
jgi:hypothetical protein